MGSREPQALAEYPAPPGSAVRDIGGPEANLVAGGANVPLSVGGRLAVSRRLDQGPRSVP